MSESATDLFYVFHETKKKRLDKNCNFFTDSP